MADPKFARHVAMDYICALTDSEREAFLLEALKPTRTTSKTIEYLSLVEAASRYGISVDILRRWIASAGARLIRVRSDDLDRLFTEIPASIPGCGEPPEFTTIYQRRQEMWGEV